MTEVAQLDASVANGYQKRGEFVNLALGGRYSGKLHLGRRAVMGFALQWIQQWTGILAIVGWAGKVFSLAGFDAYKSLWLAGLVNTFGIPGTAAAALVIDRMGRIKSLMISFITQGIALFMVAGFIKTSEDSAKTDPTKSAQYGTAAASFVFVYIWYVNLRWAGRAPFTDCALGSLQCSTLCHAGSMAPKFGHKRFVPKATASPFLAGPVGVA